MPYASYDCHLPLQGLTFISRWWNREWLKQKLTVSSVVQSYTFVMLSVETTASLEMYILTPCLDIYSSNNGVTLITSILCTALPNNRFIFWIDYWPVLCHTFYTEEIGFSNESLRISPLDISLIAQTHGGVCHSAIYAARPPENRALQRSTNLASPRPLRLTIARWQAAPLLWHVL